jgi:hypothetical protein
VGQFGTGEERDEAARDGSAEPSEPTPELVELVNLIRRYMAELGWSYNVMGRNTDASSSTWNRWCTQRKLPRREALISFADAAPRVVNRNELIGLWDAAWAAQEARQEQALAEEQPHEPPADQTGHVQSAPAIAAAEAVPTENGRRRRARGTVLVVSGLMVAAVTGGAFWLWALKADANDPSGTKGAPPVSSVSPTAQPSPTVSCHGATCNSLEPARSACAEDAVTAYTGNKYGAVIELRYSARCGAAWAKMSKTSAGDRVVITPGQGNAEEYRQQYGRDAHTPMVAVDSSRDARACAIIQDRGTVCATEPAVSTASPS